jgi:hypothetical protein
MIREKLYLHFKVVFLKTAVGLVMDSHCDLILFPLDIDDPDRRSLPQISL